MSMDRTRNGLKIAAVLCVLLILSACAVFNAANAERAAQASDTALATVLWSLCKATPVGAVKRRFQTEAKQAAYNTVCEDVLP
jgi:hypothetical protein